MLVWLMMACAGQDEGDALSPCAQEDRAVLEILDTTFSGTDIDVTVTEMDPPFPAVDDNTWVVQLTDSTGAVSGCSLSGEIDMPDHGHGGPAPAFTELGEGAYEMAARFTMGGYWEVNLSVSCATEDAVTLNICVEG